MKDFSNVSFPPETISIMKNALDAAVVAIVAELTGTLAIDGELDFAATPAADFDLDPVRHPEGDRETVIARAEVGARRRDLDDDPLAV